ncbi:MAG: glycosyltransferase family 39 protein [Gaiellaceae bacterium]
MASVEAARRPGVGLRQAIASPWATPAALTALVALSVFLRTRQLGAGLWIDEGISVGVAHHHWSSIPGLLRQDGSPPAYYMLLGLWIRMFGDGERALHSLSLLFGLACIPVAYAAARAIFRDRTTAFLAALLAALEPFLTYYGQEARMYEVEAFLSFVAAYAYIEGVLRGRRAWAVALVPTLALMVYTHNWGIFFCFGLAVATVAFARDRLRVFALVAAGTAVLYLPWLPTLLSQAKHTGAPWSATPGFHDLMLAPSSVLGGDGPYIALLLAAVVGLGAVVQARRDEERTIVLALATIAGVAILGAFVVSQISPAWTARYFAIIVGPLVLLGARGIVRAERVGFVALVAIVFFWGGYSVRNDKENAKQIAAGVQPYLHSGELVISTHPEQTPVLRYYLGARQRWATTLGPMNDPRLFDWRDAVGRLRDTRAKATLDALLATVPRGGEFVVVAPVFRDYRAWRATWTRLVWEKSSAWTWLLERDPRLHLVAHIASDEIAAKRNYFKPLQAFVYRRVA